MNPLLLDFSHEFVTDRLFIRMIQPNDGPLIYNAINASIEELKPWLTFVQKKHTQEEIELFIRMQHLNFLQRKELTFLVFMKDIQAFVACVSLHNINWHIRKLEMGYWIHSGFSGNGYVREAVQRILAFAFHELGANRVEIQCESNNIKSCAIPEKLGFQLEGILKWNKMAADSSDLRDTCIFSMTRNRYPLDKNTAN